MYRCVAVGIVAAAILVTAPGASAGPSIRVQYDRLHDAATKAFGKRVVGRDIVRYGMPVERPASMSADHPAAEVRPATLAELRKSMARMELWLHPPQPDTSNVTAPQGAVTTQSGGGGVPAELETIAQCESGGDYTAVNSSSGAYGKYQILPSTSAAYGCDMATPAGQDACAVAIYAGGAGRSQWVC